MATGRTGMTPEEVRQIAKRLMTREKTLAALLTKWFLCVMNWHRCGEGDSVEAYQEKFEELKPGFQAPQN